MTYPIYTASEAVLKLRQYIADERPMNLAEMTYLLDVLQTLVLSVKNVCMNIKADAVPSYLRNDLNTIRKKI